MKSSSEVLAGEDWRVVEEAAGESGVMVIRRLADPTGWVESSLDSAYYGPLHYGSNCNTYMFLCIYIYMYVSIYRSMHTYMYIYICVRM